jgi:hypothetical protein
MDFTLKSGAKLTVSMASFADGDELNDSVWECKKSFIERGLPIDLLAEDYFHNPRVKAAVMNCSKSAIYENAKVDARLFDDPKLGVQARGDLYEIVAKIMEINLNPFFVHASSGLSTTEPLKQ